MKLSIITINYNHKNGLKQTLRSITQQTAHDFELIIIDGNSTDGSREEIYDYANIYKFTRFVSEPDTGIYNAMNKGIDMALGDYCIFMNSGDTFYDSHSVEDSLPYLTGEYDIVSGKAWRDDKWMNPVKPENLSLTFFIVDSLNHQSTFIRRDLLLKYHYEEKYRIVSDTLFFFNTLILASATYTDIPVKVANCENAGTSGDLEMSLKERYDAIKKALPYRMNKDVDFIAKYNNSYIILFGSFLNKPFAKWFHKKIIKKFFKL